MKKNFEPKLVTALRKIVNILEAENIKYALIGGIASLLYGSERSTMDIDLLFALEKFRIPHLIDHLINVGFELSEQGVLRELTQDGLSHIKYEGITIDLLIPILPFFQFALDHAKKVEVSDFKVPVVSSEDLIIFKLLSLRPEDKRDIEMITTIYLKQLDIAYIKNWLKKMVPVDDKRVRFFAECVIRLSER